MPTYNREQQQAITSRGRSLLVSAAAGSGKTTVMVERIVSLIMQDNVPLDSLLVITFTRAAADSMRSKIRTALTRAIAEQPGSRRLAAQLETLEDSWITTIDAFCGRLLRRYASNLGLDPSFRVADTNDTALLRFQALEDAMTAAFDTHQAGFDDLAEGWGGQDGTALEELVLELHDFSMTRADRLDWLAHAAQALSCDDITATPWYDQLLQEDISYREAMEQCIQAAYDVCQLPGGPDKYLPAMTADLESLRNCSDLREFKFTALRAKNKDADPELVERAKKFRDMAKSYQKAALKGPLYEEDLSRYLEEIRACAPAMQALYRLTADFDERYASAKNLNGIMDFYDTQHYLMQALRDEEIRQDIADTFRYVFVDEYQDTNPLQDAIISSIARQDSLFLVGDVKQSIYGFRQADPTLFLQRYLSCVPFNTAGEGDTSARIDLNTNYRSSSQIIGFINLVFSRIMSRELGDVDYDENSALRPGLEYPQSDQPDVSVHLIQHEKNELTDDPQLQMLSSLERQAMACASALRQQLGHPLWDADNNCYRTCEWRDMVILLRSPGSSAQVFYDTLTRQGIPVQTDATHEFFSCLEILWLMSLLRLLDNRWRDVDMITALRSPAVNATIDELMNIRQAYPGSELSFCQAVYQYGQEQDNSLSHRISNFVQLMEELRNSPHLSIDRIIVKLMEDTGLYDTAGALPMGEMRQSNLRLVARRAKALCDQSARGLFEFVRHMNLLEETGNRPGELPKVPVTSNVVRVLSMHRSKGLEFPVVIIADLGREFNANDLRGELVHHGSLGLGPLYHNEKLKVRMATIAHSAIASLRRKELRSEEMRLLYVAMTRAQQRLVLMGTLSAHQETQLARWSAPVTPQVQLAGSVRCPLDWIGMALMVHPSAEQVRALSGSQQIRCRLDVPPIDVQLVDVSQLNTGRMIPAAVSSPFSPSAEETSYLEQWNWSYPYIQTSILPAKTTVTQILQSQNDLEHLSMVALKPLPAFMEQEQTGGAYRGTLTHQAIELIKPCQTIQETLEQIHSLIASGRLPSDALSLISPEDVLAFFRSDIGLRIAASRRVLRETPFNLSIPAEELNPRLYAGNANPVFVQGIIDLCFLEAGGWVIIDFKTNHIDGPEDADSLAEYYRPQLLLYRSALEKITSLPVNACGIYFLHHSIVKWL